MIKLAKQPEPEVLKINGINWLKLIQDKLQAGEVPTDSEKSRYRHPEIKEVLVAETHGKCAYCEGKLLHIAFGDVEHISPKSRRLDDTFRWDNLTLACDACNTYKKDAVGLVDPYTDEPAEFFSFLGPIIYAKPEKPKGITTTKRIRLNRPELILDRSKRLDAISNIILNIEAAKDEQMRSTLIDDLFENEASDNGEYAAFVRSFIAVVAPELVVLPTEAASARA